MKKVILLLVSALMALGVYAQSNNSAHLTFKGVPIDGTLNEYVAKMGQKGFTHIGTEDGIAVLQGDFAAYKNCMVTVSTLKKKDVVSTIAVIFPERDTWSGLAGNYFALKEMLTEKYGTYSECVEKFDTYSEPSDDRDRMYHVKSDRCKYYTIFETPKGSIELSISHDDVTSCYVVLIYRDKINGAAIKAAAMDDL